MWDILGCRDRGSRRGRAARAGHVTSSREGHAWRPQNALHPPNLPRKYIFRGGDLVKKCISRKSSTKVHIQTPMAQDRSTKILSTIKWIRTSRWSIQKSLSLHIREGVQRRHGRAMRCVPHPCAAVIHLKTRSGVGGRRQRKETCVGPFCVDKGPFRVDTGPFDVAKE